MIQSTSSHDMHSFIFNFATPRIIYTLPHVFTIFHVWNKSLNYISTPTFLTFRPQFEAVRGEYITDSNLKIVRPNIGFDNRIVMQLECVVWLFPISYMINNLTSAFGDSYLICELDKIGATDSLLSYWIRFIFISIVIQGK